MEEGREAEDEKVKTRKSSTRVTHRSDEFGGWIREPNENSLDGQSVCLLVFEFGSCKFTGEEKRKRRNRILKLRVGSIYNNRDRKKTGMQLSQYGVILTREREREKKKVALSHFLSSSD